MRNHTDTRCDRALQEIAKGKSSALSLLYREYGRMILSAAYQIVRSREDAEDVLQDVMERIAHSAKTYQPGTNPRAWVMAVTRNRAYDHLRDRVTVEDLDLADYGDALSYSDTERQDLYVKDALKSLSREDALLVHLKVYVGLSHAEIADILSITDAACRKRYERALDKLKEYFQDR